MARVHYPPCALKKLACLSSWSEQFWLSISVNQATDVRILFNFQSSSVNRRRSLSCFSFHSAAKYSHSYLLVVLACIYSGPRFARRVQLIDFVVCLIFSFLAGNRVSNSNIFCKHVTLKQSHEAHIGRSIRQCNTGGWHAVVLPEQPILYLLLPAGG